MSIYSEKLSTLKKEFKQIKESQKKPLKPIKIRYVPKYVPSNS